jgi:hypothetical protein
MSWQGRAIMSLLVLRLPSKSYLYPPGPETPFKYIAIKMKRPILVTGSHRSGSTWIGTIISHAPGVRYVHEPFNVGLKRHAHSPLKYWFEYITDATPDEREHEVLEYLRSFYAFPSRYILNKALAIRSAKEAYLLLADLKGRYTDRTLIKDPIAIMSAPWIQQQTHADVIVAIRHPAAFVASLMARNWHFDFNNLLQQPLLMEQRLQPFATQINPYAAEQPGIIEQGILLWNIIYSTVKDYRDIYGDRWQFIRHEDISNHPVEMFKDIFYKLDIEFNDFVQEKIIASTTALEETAQMRNARKNTKTWKHRLTEGQIEQIRTGTAAISRHFYSDEDWI